MIGTRIVRQLEQRLTTALQRLAQQVAAHAKSAAPRRSGALRESISAQNTESGAQVTAHAPHASTIELGTATQRPQPFLRPALLALKTRWRDLWQGDAP